MDLFYKLMTNDKTNDIADDFEFRKKKTFEQRKQESTAIKLKYKDRVPVICDVSKKSKNSIKLDKNKYLVPYNITIGEFLYIIRKRISLAPEKALFLHINNTLPPTSALLENVQKEYAESDGFVYMLISDENAFG